MTAEDWRRFAAVGGLRQFEQRDCGATPPGRDWPVCSLRKGHVGQHESADFYWYGESTDYYPKAGQA